PGCIRIGISRGVPRGLPAGYRIFRRLAPGPWFRSVSPVEYMKLYHAEVLSRLDPRQVVRELTDMAGGPIPVLICYEKATPNDDEQWCHRGLTAAWLHDELRLEVYEIGQEQCGCGWSHPKLHSSQ